MIELTCPKCNNSFQHESLQTDIVVKCPYCGNEFDLYSNAPDTANRSSTSKTWKVVILFIILSLSITLLLNYGISSFTRGTDTANLPSSKNSSVAEEDTEEQQKVAYNSSNSVEEARKTIVKENYGYVDYYELARNPSNYEGKALMYNGTVQWTAEDRNSLARQGLVSMEMAILVDNDEYDFNQSVYVTYIMSDTESRILENDHVSVYGIAKGLYSYQAVSGAAITLPLIEAQLIEVGE